MRKTTEYFEIFLNLKAMNEGTMHSLVLSDELYRQNINKFIYGVIKFLDVGELCCRESANTTHDIIEYRKLRSDIDFITYIARLIYAIQSVDKIFEQPRSWDRYFY